MIEGENLLMKHPSFLIHSGKRKVDKWLLGVGLGTCDRQWWLRVSLYGLRIFLLAGKKITSL